MASEFQDFFLTSQQISNHTLNYTLSCFFCSLSECCGGKSTPRDSKTFTLSRSEKRERRKAANSHYSHFVCPIAPVVDCRGHGHDERRHPIAHQIKVLPTGMFALENLHQHDIQLHPFQKHPGEGRQEEEV